MARYLYSELALAIQARKNCEQSIPPNTEWFGKWTARIRELEQLLPSGSGIDSGTTIDIGASHAEKLIMYAPFHHMNDAGYYDGWTEHTITVTPSFSGINIRVSGRNRNDIKDYLCDTYHHALTQIVADNKPVATE